MKNKDFIISEATGWSGLLFALGIIGLGSGLVAAGYKFAPLLVWAGWWIIGMRAGYCLRDKLNNSVET